MTALTNRTTGHQINVDAESVEFWQAAGYREDKGAAKKAPAKKAAAKKSSSAKK